MQCVNNVYCENFGKNLNYISYYYLKFFRNDKAHTCTYIHILYIVYHTWLGVNDPLFVNHVHQHLWCIDDTKTLSYKSRRTHTHTNKHTSIHTSNPLLSTNSICYWEFNRKTHSVMHTNTENPHVNSTYGQELLLHSISTLDRNTMISWRELPLKTPVPGSCMKLSLV